MRQMVFDTLVKYIDKYKEVKGVYPDSHTNLGFLKVYISTNAINCIKDDILDYKVYINDYATIYFGNFCELNINGDIKVTGSNFNMPEKFDIPKALNLFVETLESNSYELQNIDWSDLAKLSTCISTNYNSKLNTEEKVKAKILDKLLESKCTFNNN